MKYLLALVMTCGIMVAQRPQEHRPFPREQQRTEHREVKHRRGPVENRRHMHRPCRCHCHRRSRR